MAPGLTPQLFLAACVIAVILLGLVVMLSDRTHAANAWRGDHRAGVDPDVVLILSANDDDRAA